MTKDYQEQHLRQFSEKMEKLILSKRDDYANQDVLSNFKLAGSICQLSPAKQCLSLIATKVARLGVLLDSATTPNNESISDNTVDLANYALLLDMIINETQIIL